MPRGTCAWQVKQGGGQPIGARERAVACHKQRSTFPTTTPPSPLPSIPKGVVTASLRKGRIDHCSVIATRVREAGGQCATDGQLRGPWRGSGVRCRPQRGCSPAQPPHAPNMLAIAM